MPESGFCLGWPIRTRRGEVSMLDVELSIEHQLVEHGAQDGRLRRTLGFLVMLLDTNAERLMS